MSSPKSQMDTQLKETSQLTGVAWAVWLERSSDWEFLSVYNLNTRQRASLLKHIRQAGVRGWLSGALAGQRTRSRSLQAEPGLPGMRLYVFPDQMTQRLVLVGGRVLSPAVQRFWKTVALGGSGHSFPAPGTVPEEADPGIPYHLPQAFDHVLGMALKKAGCLGGWLSIRSGDYLEIKAHSGGEYVNERVSIDANPLLRGIVHSRQARQVTREDVDWAMVPRQGVETGARAWVGIPLLLGKRLIGLLALWRKASFRTEEIAALEQLVRRTAVSVEASVTFSDLSRHMHRLALLNDFAMSISSALEPEQVARRLFALLRRAFGTGRISLVILSQEGINAQRYLDRDGTIVLEGISPDETPIAWPVEKGQVQRLDQITPETEYQPAYPDSRSALVIPLKSRRQLIGMLGLESLRDGAFTLYDEHLLVVIASHLAGLLENSRLRREAEDRARNLSLIHAVVERVIGLTDLSRVTQIAAELMASSFAYEMVVIVLADGTGEGLSVGGIGGSAAETVRQGLKEMATVREDGIVTRVVVTGQSILVNDVSQDPLYRSITGWDAGSEMCVALREGERILGAIDVESRRKNAFTQNDLIVLEALAGILSSVISSAGQYQRLQAMVDQLRLAREELQERVAAQRMTEGRLIQAAKLAAVGEMAAGIAHELNNPLTTVSGFAELVLEGTPPESPIRADLELVLREANRARGVVRRLLDFARQSESVRSLCDFNGIVTDVLALVNHLLHTSGIRTITNLATESPWVSVDRNQMKQVFLNLVHNALHAMPAGGELQIVTAPKKRDRREGLAISVKDTGMGIARENLERVFEPFFTTRANDGGTGLGLSVSYGIVADHDGTIEVESEPGKGSTFTIWLPAETA